jgi:hypothetical protein
MCIDMLQQWNRSPLCLSHIETFSCISYQSSEIKVKNAPGCIKGNEKR